ncbi:hypothetical protein [Bacillus coahuilensis]|uniref:hypothetical protein n=1 Tax=Bacillus coahuilensis TaxID=408580 RepID=UPI00018506E7|nr:hypothetical protein [Bacillus coahuilensis]
MPELNSENQIIMEVYSDFETTPFTATDEDLITDNIVWALGKLNKYAKFNKQQSQKIYSQKQDVIRRLQAEGKITLLGYQWEDYDEEKEGKNVGDLAILPLYKVIGSNQRFHGMIKGKKIQKIIC